MAALAIFVRVEPVLAEKPEALDADFLEYLLKYEGKDDNWTVVTEGKVREQARAIAGKDKRTSSGKDQQQDARP